MIGDKVPEFPPDPQLVGRVQSLKRLLTLDEQERAPRTLTNGWWERIRVWFGRRLA